MLFPAIRDFVSVRIEPARRQGKGRFDRNYILTTGANGGRQILASRCYRALHHRPVYKLSNFPEALKMKIGIVPRLKRISPARQARIAHDRRARTWLERGPLVPALRAEAGRRIERMRRPELMPQFVCDQIDVKCISGRFRKADAA